MVLDTQTSQTGIAPVPPLPPMRREQAAQLTPAESRVLALLFAGCSNKEIAATLGRAEPTVKHQVSACLRKFGQPSRTRLISYLATECARNPAG